MAMSLGRRRGGPIAEINVTPMADVMIVLLIIFMVATPLIAHPPVRLPAALHDGEQRGERLEVLVRTDGAVLVRGSVVAAESLADWVTQLPAATRATVLVQADEGASYADVARVLSACRVAGVHEVALATRHRLGL